MEKPLMKNRETRFSKFSDALHILILLLSAFLVVDISIDTFHNVSFLDQGNYMTIQLWVCVFFMFVFWLEFFLSGHKWKYLRNRFVFFLVSIPYLNLFTYMHLDISAETGYFLRFIPLVRSGYALAIVVGWLSYNKISSLFMSYVTLLLVLFFVWEHTVNPLVVDYSDALWWAFMDVTTVGSNIYAVTATGKVLSVLLAALGMMMFPIFTVYVTNLVQQTAQHKPDK